MEKEKNHSFGLNYEITVTELCLIMHGRYHLEAFTALHSQFRHSCIHKHTHTQCHNIL